MTLWPFFDRRRYIAGAGGLLVAVSLTLAGIMAGGCAGRKNTPAVPPHKEFTFEDLLITSGAADAESKDSKLTREVTGSGWTTWANDKRDNLRVLADEYLEFLRTATSEYEVIEHVLTIARKKGFVEHDLFAPLAGSALAPGSKLLFIDQRHASIVLVVTGTQRLTSGGLFAAGCLDLPHMSIKQNPLFAKHGFVLWQTAYSGYPRKHQWLSVPLGLAGRVYKKNGDMVQVRPDHDSPIVIIPDLLPHLASREQRSMLIRVEDLDVVMDHAPLAKDRNEALTMQFLQVLRKEHRIEPDDLVTADLELVPLYPPAAVGVDRGLVGGYGQSVKAPAFVALEAISSLAEQSQTAILVLVSGKDPDDDFSEYTTVIKSLGTTLLDASLNRPASAMELQAFLARSRAMSLGVVSGVNPVFKDGWAEIAYGPALITKDEDPRYLRQVLEVFKRREVVWQSVEKEYRDREIDHLLEKEGMPCINLLCPVLGEGSFCEMVSKMDLYLTHHAVKAFWENDFNN
jgi:aspartyl aminopeptidase